MHDDRPSAANHGDRVHRVTLAGDYDELNRDQLHEKLMDGLGCHILVDCSAVTYLGSTGLAVFIEVQRQARLAGGDLRLTSLSYIVEAAVRAAGLAPYLMQ